MRGGKQTPNSSGFCVGCLPPGDFSHSYHGNCPGLLPGKFTVVLLYEPVRKSASQIRRLESTSRLLLLLIGAIPRRF